jgi:hypothetical protein
MSKKGWSKSGTLVTGVDNAITMQASFIDEPGYYTVQFNNGGVQPAVGMVQQVLAETVWTVEGNSVRRLITVGDGASISGAGQSVNVKVFDNSSIPAVSPSQRYNISMQMVKGTRPAQSQQPILEVGDNMQRGVTSVFSLAAGANHDFVIPQDVGITSVYVSILGTLIDEIVSGEVQGYFLANGVTLKSFNYDSCNKWLAVPPGATDLNIVNFTAANLMNVTLTYGIDG